MPNLPMPLGGIIKPKSIEEIRETEAIEKQKKIAEEQEKRFNVIADKIIKILAEEKVISKELPSIVTILTNRVNKKMNESEIDKILKL